MTRAPERQDELGALLASLGAGVVFCPAIEIAPPLDWTPLDIAIRSLRNYDWIVFTSQNAVDQLLARIASITFDAPMLSPVWSSIPPSIRIAAVGRGTRDDLEGHGIRVNAMPVRALADEVPDSLGEINGLRILLPRSDLARPELPAALRARGAVVDEVIAYRTVSASGAVDLAEHVRCGTVDAITFASASAVRAFVSAIRSTLDLRDGWRNRYRPRIVAIGPVTAAAAAELGLPVDAVATQHDAPGLARAVVECLSPLSVETS